MEGCDAENYEAIVRLWNKTKNAGDPLRGYAGCFNYDSELSKSRVEMAVAVDWSQALAARYTCQIEMPRTNPDDPPDICIQINGKDVGVELVQLIERGHKERSLRGESAYHGRLIMDMLWDRDRFAAKLENIIRDKGDKYAKRKLRFDVLLIFTDEPYLSACQVEGWLAEIAIPPHLTFERIFLMLDERAGKIHCPVFLLSGDGFQAMRCRNNPTPTVPINHTPPPPRPSQSPDRRGQAPRNPRR